MMNIKDIVPPYPTGLGKPWQGVSQVDAGELCPGLGFDGWNVDIRDIAPACSVILVHKNDDFFECDDTINTIIMVAPIPHTLIGHNKLRKNADTATVLMSLVTSKQLGMKDVHDNISGPLRYMIFLFDHITDIGKDQYRFLTRLGDKQSAFKSKFSIMKVDARLCAHISTVMEKTARQGRNIAISNRDTMIFYEDIMAPKEIWRPSWTSETVDDKIKWNHQEVKDSNDKYKIHAFMAINPCTSGSWNHNKWLEDQDMIIHITVGTKTRSTDNVYDRSAFNTLRDDRKRYARHVDGEDEPQLIKNTMVVDSVDDVVTRTPDPKVWARAAKDVDMMIKDMEASTSKPWSDKGRTLSDTDLNNWTGWISNHTETWENAKQTQKRKPGGNDPDSEKGNKRQCQTLTERDIHRLIDRRFEEHDRNQQKRDDNETNTVKHNEIAQELIDQHRPEERKRYYFSSTEGVYKLFTEDNHPERERSRHKTLEKIAGHYYTGVIKNISGTYPHGEITITAPGHLCDQIKLVVGMHEIAFCTLGKLAIQAECIYWLSFNDANGDAYPQEIFILNDDERNALGPVKMNIPDYEGLKSFLKTTEGCKRLPRDDDDIDKEIILMQSNTIAHHEHTMNAMKTAIAMSMYEISDLRTRLHLRDEQYCDYKANAGEGALLTESAWKGARNRVIKDMHFKEDNKLLPWAVGTRSSSSTHEGRRAYTIDIKDGIADKKDTDPDARSNFHKEVRQEFWNDAETRPNVRAELQHKMLQAKEEIVFTQASQPNNDTTNEAPRYTAEEWKRYQEGAKQDNKPRYTDEEWEAWNKQHQSPKDNKNERRKIHNQELGAARNREQQPAGQFYEHYPAKDNWGPQDNRRNSNLKTHAGKGGAKGNRSGPYFGSSKGTGKGGKHGRSNGKGDWKKHNQDDWTNDQQNRW